MKINKKIIEELTGYLKEFNLSEIEYAEGSTKVKVSRSINTSSAIPSEINKNVNYYEGYEKSKKEDIEFLDSKRIKQK